MTRNEFILYLAERPCLCDGAMGTQLLAKGLPTDECGERWNVEQPETIESIHRNYRQAGCEWITTNTFQGSAPALEPHGLAGQVVELNRAAAAIARRAANGQAVVLGDMGPFGGFLEPYGDMQTERLLDIFVQQATALREGGADAAIVETMADPQELTVAVRAARSVGNWVVIATYAFEKQQDGSYRTMMGTGVADAIRAALDVGADIVGANCGTSLALDDYGWLAEQLVAAAGETPVILQPNAGAPSTSDGELVYAASPESMARAVSPLLSAGVRVIGGCCGTTPDHLQAMKKALDEFGESVAETSVHSDRE